MTVVDRQYFAGSSPALLIETTTGISSPTLNLLFTGPYGPPPVAIVTLTGPSEAGAAAPASDGPALVPLVCKPQRAAANSSAIGADLRTLLLLQVSRSGCGCRLLAGRRAGDALVDQQPNLDPPV